MRTGPRTHRFIAALLGAVLLALPVAAAQAPGTYTLDLTLHAGPATLRPGPLAVPNPVLPNPAYDPLVLAAPASSMLPAQVENTPAGLFVEPPGGAPIQLVGWRTGIEQRRIAPVEFAARALAPEAMRGALQPVAPIEPPLTLGGCACAPAPPLAVGGRFSAPLAPVSPPGLAPGGVPGEAVRRDEVAPGPAPVETFSAAPAPWEPQLANPREAELRPTSLAPAAPVAGDEMPLAAAALLAGAALVAAKLLLPLYHRFRRKNALDNATRKRIYEHLRDAPGSSAAELSAKSDLHVTTVKYHLDVLRRVGMVGEEVVDGCRRFYSYENGDRAEFLARALLDEPSARAIYGAIEAHPGLPFIEVARAVGMRKEHVHYHVKKLAKHGLIADKWEGGRRLLFPATPPEHGRSEVKA